MSYLFHFLRLDASLLHRSILIVPTVVAVAIYGFLSTTRSKMGARWLRFVIFLKKMSYFIQILGFLNLHRDLAIRWKLRIWMNAGISGFPIEPPPLSTPVRATGSAAEMKQGTIVIPLIGTLTWVVLLFTHLTMGSLMVLLCIDGK